MWNFLSRGDMLTRIEWKSVSVMNWPTYWHWSRCKRLHLNFQFVLAGSFGIIAALYALSLFSLPWNKRETLNVPLSLNTELGPRNSTTWIVMDEDLCNDDGSMQSGHNNIHSLWELIENDALQCTGKKKIFYSFRKKCNQCDFSSSRRDHLRTHLKTHRGAKSNKCNKCDYASSQADVLRTHLKTHRGEKSYKCNQCDNAFSRTDNLRAHLDMHSGEKSYVQVQQVWQSLLSARQF